MKKDQKLKIVVGNPPNVARCVEVFRIDPRETFFTYGDTLYNPGGHELVWHLLAHELTHAFQQRFNTKDAAEWWDKYFLDPKFRLDQELEAYAVQYHAYCARVKDRNQQARFLYYIANEVASERYGKMIGATEAMGIIRKLKIKDYE